MQRKLHAGRHGQKGGEGSMNTQSHMSLISTRSFHLIYLTGPRENDARSTNSLNSIRWFHPCLPLPLPQPDTPHALHHQLLWCRQLPMSSCPLQFGKLFSFIERLRAYVCPDIVVLLSPIHGVLCKDGIHPPQSWYPLQTSGTFLSRKMESARQDHLVMVSTCWALWRSLIR